MSRILNANDAGPTCRRRPMSVAALAVALALAACDGSGSGDDPTPLPVSDDSNGPFSDPADSRVDGGDATSDGSVIQSVNGGSGDDGADPAAGMPTDPAAPAGDIARYGVIAVGDTNGLANGDLRATFSALPSPVAPEAFGAALMPGASVCTVSEADGGPDQETRSAALFLPTPGNVSRTAIGAGGTVLLSSAAGSWIDLTEMPSSGFYTLSSVDAVPTGRVPTGLLANVTGDAFPAFVDSRLPDVMPLVDVSSGDGAITPETRFTWQAGTGGNARVRIQSMSAGSFFVEDGAGVTCLVPDSGEFVFPADTRQALGATFSGTGATLSRIAIDSVQDGDALLVLVRESFSR